MTTAASDHLVLTVEEAAERLGVGRTMMYALVKSGAIESICIGRLRRIPGDALEAFIRGLRQRSTQARAESDPHRAP
jgi:excisionase family DNA binding protein